jgi:hypothetical protein
MGVEYVMKNALLRRSLDNVTVVVIGFESFQRKLHHGIQYSPQQHKSSADISVTHVSEPRTNNSSSHVEKGKSTKGVVNVKHTKQL